MRLDAHSGVRGLLINADTGKPIRWVCWADLPDDPQQQGEYEAFREEPTAALARGIPLSSLRYQGRARLRFVRAAPVFRSRPSERRDLMGSLAEARARVDRRLLVLSEECCEPRCHQRAQWAVSWEQLIEPERDSEGKLHERAVCVRQLAFCSSHYRPPVVRNLRGVESEVEVEVRPE